MKNLSNAERKKAMKQFKIGDIVTWGFGKYWFPVIEVNPRGCVVDVGAMGKIDPFIDHWAKKQADGRYHVLVLFDANTPSGPQCRFEERGVIRGPVRHVSRDKKRLQ